MTLLRSSHLLTSVLLVGSLVACRSGDSASTSSSSSSEGGSGGSSGTEGSGASSSAGGANAGGEGQGGIAGCEGPEATVQGITGGDFGPGSKVALTGVVAMSQKFLVSKSKSTNNCLWGVFVSAPGLTETAANTGILILSYGTKASIPEGGDTAYCPRLGQDPAGDKIPDGTLPGDVLDVVGVVSRFPDPPECASPNPPNQVGMLQLSSVCKAEKTGTAAVPAPHVLTADELASISSTTDKEFHDQWGAVKVRAENLTVEPQNGQVVGDFGKIKFTNGLEIGNKIYYRGYSNNFCHEGPVFTDPAAVFTRVDGFHYLDYCTWGLQPNDKCSDYDPKSGDCAEATTCPPDILQ
jgi:hypothetical protein